MNDFDLTKYQKFKQKIEQDIGVVRKDIQYLASRVKRLEDTSKFCKSMISLKELNVGGPYTTVQ